MIMGGIVSLCNKIERMSKKTIKKDYNDYT
ncbi:MAG: hypothetical protein ACJASU_001465 [Cognaticolwellia sp.]|jgi:hypothetical protein